MSLSRIFSRFFAPAIITVVGFSAMFVSIDVPVDSSTGTPANTIAQYLQVPTTFAGSGAADSTSTGTKKDTIEEWGDQIVKGANFGLEILYAFLIPLTLLAGWLLSPDWTFGDIFGLRAVIHGLWVLVSNVVYIIFAFALVAIAFVNIYSGGGNFAIKKALPRFFIGILIVPFTWFIVSATLSLSNILTASVLRLPYDMMTTEQRSYELKIPKECTLKFNQKDPVKSGQIFTCDTKGANAVNTIKLGDFISGGKSAYNLVTAYAYSVFNINTLKEISGNKIDTMQGILNGGLQLIVGIISFFVFALLLLALCFALFTRAFYMWIMAIFSPLFGLFYFFGGKISEAKKLEDQIGFTKFLGLAMVPVYVSAALSFGLLFLTMTQNVDLSKSISASSYWQNVTGDKTQTTFSVWQIANGDPVMNVKVEGQPLYVDGAANGAAAGVKLGQNAIGKIIVSILGIVVLWMAVMAALRGSDITKTAVAPIEGFGKSIADMAKAIPSHIPMIPIPWQKTPMNLAWLKWLGDNMASAIQNAGVKQGRDLGDTFWNKIAAHLGGINESQQKATRAIQEMTSADKVSNAAKNVRDAHNIKNADGLKDTGAQESFKKWVDTIPAKAFKNEDEASMTKIRDKFKENIKNPTKAFKELNEALKVEAQVKNKDGDVLKTEKEILDYFQEGNIDASATKTSTPSPTTSKIRTVEIFEKAIPDDSHGKKVSIVGAGDVKKDFDIPAKNQPMTPEKFNELATHMGVADAEKDNFKAALVKKDIKVG